MMKNIVESLTLTANSPKISGGGSSHFLTNHSFSLKALRICAMLLLLCLGVGQMGAETRYFDGNTKFYVMNYKPSGLGGSTLWATGDNCKFYFDLVDGSANHHWYEAELVSGSGAYSEGAIYAITPDAGTYSYFIMTRGWGTGFEKKHNQTGNIGFHSDASYNLVNGGYDKDGTGTTWGKISPKPVTSDGTGVLYFNGAPSSASWWKDYGANRQSAYFFNNTTGEFTSTSVSVTGNYYKVTVPSGTWTGLILTRHNEGTTTPSWENKCNQTQDIPLVEGKNYLSNFGEAPGTYTWEDYIPASTIVLNGAMNDWSLITAKPFTDGSLDVNLSAHETYDFKIVDGGAGGSGTWYGLTNVNAITTSMTEWTCNSGNDGKNIPIATAGEGKYTFAFNGSHQLSITYPTVSHPNADYVYMIKYTTNWDGHKIYLYSSSSGVSGNTWPGQDLFDGNTITYGDDTYYYAAVGDYQNIQINDGVENTTEKSSDDASGVSGNFGKRLYHNGTAWTWGNFTFSVTLYTNGGTINAGNITSYTFGTGATLPTNVTRTGYYFAGWYANSDFTGERVYSISTTENTNKTYYAKWEHEWTLAGNKWSNWDKDVNPLDNVGTNANSKDTCYIELELEVDSTYSFKLIRHNAIGNKQYYALTSYESMYYASSHTTGTFAPQKNDDPNKRTGSCTVRADVAGTYKFVLNITDMTVTVVYPASYQVTATTAGGGTVSPSSAKYFSQSVGYDITATPDYAHYFNGWTVTSGSGTIEDNTAASTNFQPSETSTVSAAFAERSAFLQGRFRVRNSSGTPILTKADGGWANYEHTIKMSYDAENNRYYLHTYSTPAELMEQINSNDPMFYIKTSTSSESVTDGVSYAPDNSPADNSLDSPGEEVAVSESNTRGSYIRGSEEANVILYFDGTKVWYETEQKTFTDASEDHKWSTASNWSPSGVPTIVDIVYITKPVTVDVTDAVAKRIIIDQTDDNTGKLQIGAAKKLVVAQTIQVDKGEGPVATTSEDLLIGSSSSGNGALVWGTASTTPGDAQVEFYTKSGGSKNSTASVNQFIGTPFQSHTNWVYNYDNSWLLNVDYSGAKPVFDLLARGQDMNPFEGYCIIYNGDPGNIYEMTGTLVTNADHTCSSLSYKSDDGGNSANENLLANSWLAPIRIAAFESSDFVKTDATIYIFNAGSKDDKDKGEATKGQYSTYPIGSAGDNVIPSMQSFSVYTNASGGSSVTLDYSKLVYAPAVAGTAAVGPNKAPQRTQAEMNKVRLYVRGDKGFGDMVYMLEDENFTPGFDNCWDGRKMFGESFAPQMFALSEDGNMAVNAVPDFDGTLLGFKAGTEDSQYTITFDYEGTDYLYLYDMQTAEQTLISNEASYTFTSSDKEAHNRFIINKAPKVATGVENGELLNGANGVRKVLMDNHLYIIRDGKLFNATGALVK